MLCIVLTLELRIHLNSKLNVSQRVKKSRFSASEVSLMDTVSSTEDDREAQRGLKKVEGCRMIENYVLTVGRRWGTGNAENRCTFNGMKY